jgi:hypothetical protein
VVVEDPVHDLFGHTAFRKPFLRKSFLARTGLAPELHDPDLPPILIFSSNALRIGWCTEQNGLNPAPSPTLYWSVTWLGLLNSAEKSANPSGNFSKTFV